MEKYPSIDDTQFTVQFVDRKTGIVLCHDFRYFIKSSKQKIYSIHNSLKEAIEYAAQRIKEIDHKNNIIAYLIRDAKEQLVLHTDNDQNKGSLNYKTIVIDGDNFSTEEGFYNEIDRVLTSELDWKTGHNLNAFNDLLRGGFCVHEYEEPIELIWKNSRKSKEELNDKRDDKSFYEIVVEIIKDHSHIAFKEK